MDVSVFDGGGGRFVAIFLKLVGKGKRASRSAAYVFFADIGRIYSDMEDYPSGIILDWDIRVGCRVFK